MSFGPLASHPEARLHRVGLERVEDPSGVAGVGAGIEGEGHDLARSVELRDRHGSALRLGGLAAFYKQQRGARNRNQQDYYASEFDVRVRHYLPP